MLIPVATLATLIHLGGVPPAQENTHSPESRDLTQPFQPPQRLFAPQEVPFNLVLFGGAPFSRLVKDTGVVQYRFRPLSIISLMNPDLDWKWSFASPFLQFVYETYADPNLRASVLKDSPALDRLLQRWPFGRFHTLIEELKPGDHTPNSYLWTVEDSRLAVRYAAYVRGNYPPVLDDEILALGDAYEKGNLPKEEFQTKVRKALERYGKAVRDNAPTSYEVGRKDGIRSGLFQVYVETARNARWNWRRFRWEAVTPEDEVQRPLRVKSQKATPSSVLTDGAVKQRTVTAGVFQRAMGTSAGDHIRRWWKDVFAKNGIQGSLPSKDEAFRILVSESEDLKRVEAAEKRTRVLLKAATSPEDIRFYQQRLEALAKSQKQVLTHLATFVEFNDPLRLRGRFSPAIQKILYQAWSIELSDILSHAKENARETFQFANFFNVVFDVVAWAKKPEMSLWYQIRESMDGESRGTDLSEPLERRRRYLRDRDISHRLTDALSPWLVGLFASGFAETLGISWKKMVAEKKGLHYWVKGAVQITTLWAVTFYAQLVIDYFFKHQYPDLMLNLLTCGGELPIGPMAFAIYAVMVAEATLFASRGIFSIPNLVRHFRSHPLPAVVTLASVVYVLLGINGRFEAAEAE